MTTSKTEGQYETVKQEGRTAEIGNDGLIPEITLLAVFYSTHEEGINSARDGSDVLIQRNNIM